MRPYELLTVLAPDIPEDELDPTIDTIETYVTRLGGEVIVINRDSPWGRRRLAYPIRHAGRDVRDGFYVLWYFDTEPSTISGIEREIRLNDRIIRHMIVALDEQVTLLPIEPADEESANSEEEEAVDVAAGAEAPEASADETPAEVEAPEASADETPAEAEAPEASADETPAEASETAEGDSDEGAETEE